MKNCLYPFLGIHSFLIGLFPFYIPVYLYAGGFSLQQVCIFVALTGIGYCACLYLWDRVHRKWSLRLLIVFSFICEILLLSLFLLEKNLYFLISAGFINGAYNCNFWIIQRLLFLQTITDKNSGRKFGNFQIFVLIVLKIAIFTGGVLLERSGFLPVYLLSCILACGASIFFLYKKVSGELDGELVGCQPLYLREIVSFRDALHSRTVFAIDGIFLFLESYFWVISLYLIVNESFSRLGLLVVLLALFFGIFFILIKNSIDRLPVDIFYRGAVALYCFSWFLRSLLSDRLQMTAVVLLLALITFFTSIFRLAFNKRFFDIAKTKANHEYIFLKSYYSQAFLLVFLAVAMVVPVLFSENSAENLRILYFGGALLAPLYLIYRGTEHN